MPATVSGLVPCVLHKVIHNFCGVIFEGTALARLACDFLRWRHSEWPFLGRLFQWNTVPARAALDDRALLLGWACKVIHKMVALLHRPSQPEGNRGALQRRRLAAEFGGRHAGPAFERTNKAFFVQIAAGLSDLFDGALGAQQQVARLFLPHLIF